MLPATLAAARALVSVVCTIQPPVPPEQAGPPTEQSPAADDLSKLGMDELIKRLPPAGCEWRYERGAGEGEKNLASVEMARRMFSGTLTDEQWRAALLTTGAIRFHKRWPKDEPYAASMTVPRWLGVTEIRLTPRAEGMNAIAAGELMIGFSGTVPMMRARDARAGQSMGKLPEGVRELVFDVEVERGDSRSFLGPEDEKVPAAGMLWKGTITTPVELVDSVPQILPEAKGAALDAAVRDAIGVGVRPWGSGAQRYAFVLIDPDCTKYPELATTGLDIKVELLDGDRVLDEGSLVATDIDPLTLMASICTAPRQFYGSAMFELPGVDVEKVDTSAWKVRLTGGGDHAWVLWNARQRWAGMITIPWSEALGHEAERVGPAGRGPECSVPYFK